MQRDTEGRGPFIPDEVSPRQDFAPCHETPGGQSWGALRSGPRIGAAPGGDRPAGPTSPGRARAPLDNKRQSPLPPAPIHPAPPFPDPRNQVQGSLLQNAPVPASSYWRPAPSPVQAKERAESREQRQGPSIPTPGSGLLVLCTEAPGGQFWPGSREQSCKRQRDSVSPARLASWRGRSLCTKLGPGVGEPWQ